MDHLSFSTAAFDHIDAGYRKNLALSACVPIDLVKYVPVHVDGLTIPCE